jgi:hypothetical protein
MHDDDGALSSSLAALRDDSLLKGACKTLTRRAAARCHLGQYSLALDDQRIASERLRTIGEKALSDAAEEDLRQIQQLAQDE